MHLSLRSLSHASTTVVNGGPLFCAAPPCTSTSPASAEAAEGLAGVHEGVGGTSAVCSGEGDRGELGCCCLAPACTVSRGCFGRCLRTVVGDDLGAAVGEGGVCRPGESSFEWKIFGRLPGDDGGERASIVMAMPETAHGPSL